MNDDERRTLCELFAALDPAEDEEAIARTVDEAVRGDTRPLALRFALPAAELRRLDTARPVTHESLFALLEGMGVTVEALEAQRRYMHARIVAGALWPWLEVSP